MKSSKGITLVALVITIIVLLILAGVSISLVVGDNGVLTQSQNAATKTDIASAKSALELTLTSIYSDFMGEVWSDDVTAKIIDNTTVWKLDQELQNNGYYIVQFGDTGINSGDKTTNKPYVKDDIGVPSSYTDYNSTNNDKTKSPYYTRIVISELPGGGITDHNNTKKNTTYAAILKWDDNNVSIAEWEEPDSETSSIGTPTDPSTWDAE